MHRLGVREIVELLVLRDVAQRGALARQRLHRALVRRIGLQPQVAAHHRVGVVDRETLQVVAGAAAAAAEVGVAGREVNGEPDLALELLFEPPGKSPVRVKARDLVLVLVRHQLVEIDRHGAGEGSSRPSRASAARTLATRAR